MTTLTRRFRDALTFAVQCHEGQVRKGTTVPYVSHPLQVAGLVLEHGGDEEAAIAALLHDVLEDTDVPKAEIVPDNCWGCGVCVSACEDIAVDAITMFEARPPEHIPGSM